MIAILIIGSKGFIGSHAYCYFSSKPGEYECCGSDVVVDYTDAKYLLLDSTNCDYNQLFEDTPFDVCINCSGASSVPDSMIHPLRDFTLNVTNVVKIMEAVRRYRPQCKFINLSSAAVYGNPKNLPVSEMEICAPVSPYGHHKLMAEKACEEYATYFGLQTCSLRIFSAYGPGLKKQLLWDIFQKTMQADIVNLFGTGEESRDFIYVTDIIHSIEMAIYKGEFNGAVYNVANGIEISIRQLAEMLLTGLNYTGKLVFTGQRRSGDPVNWRADITKIKSAGYAPKIIFKEGIGQYIKWLKEEKLH